MRTLSFDGGMGASGDMLLGALVAVGAPIDALTPVEDALEIKYDIQSTDKNGLLATSVDVRGVDESSEGHRSYDDVVGIIDSMDLPREIRVDAIEIVRLLGTAEAAVHGTDLETVAFHEVGADDAIADITGVVLLLDALDVDRVVTTPISAGGGSVSMTHGRYPVPTPVVVELAKHASWQLQSGPVDAELLTPTGAAILTHVADGVDRLPPLSIEESGYGAGDRDFSEYPNVLRAIIGTERGGLQAEEITVLETTVDDVSPEILGGLQETLGEVGARDVSITPVTMKKSRPGHVVTVITKPVDAEQVARRLAEETGTLGIRETRATHRWIANRSLEHVQVEIAGDVFEVGVKIASDTAGRVYDVSAEYDDARDVATKVGVPIREIMRIAEETMKNRE